MTANETEIKAAEANEAKPKEPMTDEQAKEVVGGARPGISNEEAERREYNRWYYRTGGSAPSYGRAGR